MRISTSWSNQIELSAMQTKQASLTRTQIELTAQKKILTGADNPTGAAQIVDLNQNISQTKQFQSNISTAQQRLELEDSVLSNSADIMYRIKELAVQGLNATLSPNDRNTIAQEMEGLNKDLLGLANTKNANGEYLFSGYKSSTPAFSKAQSSTPGVTGAYVYNGDSHSRLIQIGLDRHVTDGDPGINAFGVPSGGNTGTQSPDVPAAGSINNVFEAIDKFVADLRAPDSTQGSAVATSAVNLTVNLSANTTPPSSATIDPTNPESYNHASTTKIYDANGKQHDLTSYFRKESTGDWTAFHFITETPGSKSIPIDIGGIGTPLSFDADGKITSPSEPVQLDSWSPTGGTAVSLKMNYANSTQQESAFAVNNQTQNGSANPQKPSTYSLDDFDRSLENIITTQSSVGVRLKVLDSQKNMNDDYNLNMKSVLSNVQDLDYAEAISRFNLENVSLQAAQQAYAQVKKLSLFDYI